jgi:hypothetical protein
MTIRSQVNTDDIYFNGRLGRFGNSVAGHLQVRNLGRSRVVIQASSLSVQGIMASDVNLTINTSINGANGLDVGVRENDNWYGVFVIVNEDASNVAGLVSLSDTPALPEGYSSFRRVAWFRAIDNEVRPFEKVGEKTFYSESPLLYTNPGSGTGKQALNLDFSDQFPPGTKMGSFSVWGQVTNSQGDILFRESALFDYSSVAWVYSPLNNLDGALRGGGAGDSTFNTFFWTVSQNRTIDVSWAALSTIKIWANGYIG